VDGSEKKCKESVMSFLFEMPRKEETEDDQIADQIKRKMERLVALLEDADLEFAIKDPLTGEMRGNMKGVVRRKGLLDRVRDEVKELLPGKTVQINNARPSDVSSCVSKIKKEQPDKLFKSVSMTKTETLIVRVK
jgi:hypothetical protein